MTKTFQLIFFLTLFALKISAQNYYVKKLTTSFGLSDNCVVSIAQDKDGCIWIATEEGLNRFDGNEFEKFFKSERNLNSLSGNELNCILDDPTDSVLWIATQRAGLNAYDYSKGKFRIFNADKNSPDSLISDAVTKITPSKDGSIWIATYWSGVDYYDKENQKFIHYNSNTIKDWNPDNIWTVLEGSHDEIFIGYIHQGLGIYNRKSRSFKLLKHIEGDNESIPSDEVLSIYEDFDQNVWVGTRAGLALLNRETLKFTDFNELISLGKTVYDIKMAENRRLWVAMEQGGIAIADFSKQISTQNIEVLRLKEEYSDKGLSGNSVRCITTDKNGNLWAGIWNAGLNFINPKGNVFRGIFYSPRAENPLDKNTKNLNCKSILSVTGDNEGRLWIGTDGGGINVFSFGKRIAVYNSENSGLKNNCVQAAYKDSKGNLWFGTFHGGIAVYDFKSQSFQPLAEGMDIRGFCAYDENHIIVATSSGILLADIDKKQIVSSHKLPQNLVRNVLKDSYGNIWAGTFGGGLFILDRDFSVIKRFDTDNGFPSNTVNYIKEDSQKRIWVATGEGLVFFAEHENFDFKVISKKAGLKNAHIRAISEDRYYNIWVSTNSGISCYLPEYKKVRNYDSHYGIPSGEFASGAVFYGGDGVMNFGSVAGLCRFVPEEVLTERNTPQAKIAKIKIYLPGDLESTDRQNVKIIHNAGGKIVLKHDENSFAISLFVDNYALSNIIEYATMLEGAEKNYYRVNDAENVIFRNLSPGKYMLKIKTRFISKNFESKTTDLRIIVLPPWYQTKAANTFYVLLILGAIFLSFKAYKRRVNIRAQLKSEKENREKQEALNEEKMRFYTNIAHEIRTPLSLIVGPLEDLATDTKLEENVRKKLKLINQSSQKLLKLANNLLDLRKTETRNKKLYITQGILNQVIEQETLKYKELNRNKDLEIIYECEENDFEMFFDRQCIITILGNLISNSLKYTEKGFIKVSLSKRGNYAVISVKDTGYGISKEALPKIFDRYYQEQGTHQASGTGIGLSLVKNLIELHQGKVEVSSVLGIGTEFLVSIPLEGKYETSDNEELQEIIKDKNLEENNKLDSQETESSKPVVLSVEDNTDIQEYIRISLSQKYTIITAHNGKLGIQAALEKIPDIIVSDIMMPVKNGIELCKAIKNDIRTSHIPVILLTAKDTLEDKTEGYDAGADSYLTKPFSATLLASRIENLLEKKHRLKEFFSAKTPVEPVKKAEATLKNQKEEIIKSLNPLDAEFIEKTDKIISENIENPDFSVTMLCEKNFMSTSSLYRKLKALTGISPNEYIRKIKMQTAGKLLSEGRYSIAEVAFKVGIRTEDYFRQCFKDEFGVVPSEFLKEISQ
ncbi:MAG: response regulator [Bacteroidales bacterium]|nr:response regulator [Bacteroidales bacterium]